MKQVGTRALAPLILLLISSGCSLLTDSSKTRIEELNAAAARELPVGSDKSHVFSFLDSRRIEHSDYMDAQGNPNLLPIYGASGRIDGIIRDVRKGLFFKSSISLIFLFDKGGKLVSYQIKEAVTGP